MIDRAVLAPHQDGAVAFVEPRRAALLHMHMGTGKTFAVIYAVEKYVAARAAKGKRDPFVVLVVCPRSVIPNWTAQVTKHAERTWHVAELGEAPVLTRIGERAGRSSIGGARGGKLAVSAKAKWINALPKHVEYASALGCEVFLIVMNYDIVRNAPMTKALAKQKFDLTVADESHKAKAPKGATAKALWRIGVVSARRLALTGTPMPHSPLDIWAQFRFLDPTIFGTSFWVFRSEYAVMGGFKGKAVTSFRNIDRLKAKMAAITYQVGAEVMNRAKPTSIDYEVDLGDRARAIYDSLDKTFSAEVKSGTVTATNALVKLLRLEQVTSGCVRLDPESIDDERARFEIVDDAKRDALADILEGLAPDEPVVVFARFRSDLDQISEVVGAEHYRELSGRRHNLGHWQKGGGRVLGVQIQAGGAGIDLTRACIAIYFSVGYSLGDFEQSLARVDRPPNARPIIIFHLIARNTRNRKVYEALMARKQVVEYVLADIYDPRAPAPALNEGTEQLEHCNPT